MIRSKLNQRWNQNRDREEDRNCIPTEQDEGQTSGSWRTQRYKRGAKAKLKAGEFMNPGDCFQRPKGPLSHAPAHNAFRFAVYLPASLSRSDRRRAPAALRPLPDRIRTHGLFKPPSFSAKKD
ncbi:hypothetical protein EVAR_78242_1 [Eumeta japonica]|uniref:Uncharacterized protein n=1 Tax=Eumeta variegata TaxID=151549 RepID=A0A4C1T5J3_EUMVA|nr:hypothetical protein EVAR_78242_1 [Eumeta japonica]